MLVATDIHIIKNSYVIFLLVSTTLMLDTSWILAGNL